MMFGRCRTRICHMHAKLEQQIASVDNHLARILYKVETELFDGINVMISGGSVRKAMFGMPLGTSDIDVFFKSKADMDEGARRLMERNCSLKRHPNCIGSHVSRAQYDLGEPTVYMQLITKEAYPTMEQLVAEYDWTVCQFGFSRGVFYFTKEAIEDEYNKRLRYTPTSKRITSITRFVKYLSLGYQPDAELIHQMLVKDRTELVRFSEELDNMEGLYDSI